VPLDTAPPVAPVLPLEPARLPPLPVEPPVVLDAPPRPLDPAEPNPVEPGAPKSFALQAVIKKNEAATLRPKVVR